MATMCYVTARDYAKHFAKTIRGYCWFCKEWRPITYEFHCYVCHRKLQKIQEVTS